MPVIMVPFDVSDWQVDPVPMALGEGGPVLFARAGMRKTFTGALTGTSAASMTSVAVGQAPVGYSAVELVTGVLDGRSGSFVLQHSGVAGDASPAPAGLVLPGTGTSELVGLRGTMVIEHDASGPVLHLDYQLGPEATADGSVGGA